MDKLAKKLIEYGFVNRGHCVEFSKNGIDFIWIDGQFIIGNDFEQSTIKMRTVNIVNIKRVIKGITDFTLIKA